MADARTVIFGALRAARPPVAARPPRAPRAPRDGDPVARFGRQLAAAGGRLVDARSGSLGDILASLAGPDRATHVYSVVADAPSRGDGAGAAGPADLARLEVAVLAAACGVAESGAVWHSPADPVERAAALLAEHLVLVLDAGAIVHDLHDAYARVDVAAARFGWWLCGPSKTADIEQALVLGAHGPCRATVVLR
jgi:L-lactate dehydrogenase complex protein LldG